MSEIFNTSSIFSGPTTPTKPRALLGLSPTKKDGTAPAQSTRLTTPVKPKLIGGKWTRSFILVRRLEDPVV